MSTPQDPAKRKKQKTRRTKKLAAWRAKQETKPAEKKVETKAATKTAAKKSAKKA